MNCSWTLALLVACAFGADSSQISAARCRKTFVPGSASQFVGQAGWQNQADGSIVGSTEHRTVGRTLMTCIVKFPVAAASAVLDFRGAHISFTGAKSGGGFELAVHTERGSPVCTLSGMRMSGENWIELGPAQYALNFDRAVERVNVRFMLNDTSDASALRVDLSPISIRARREGDNPIDCPPAVR